VQGDVFDADSLAEAVQGVTGVSESHRGLGM
jgi:uncharacterized protein YbjT (DUF2867 family)